MCTAFETQPFASLYRNWCYGVFTHVFVITFLTRRELAVFTAFVQMAFVDRFVVVGADSYHEALYPIYHC